MYRYQMANSYSNEGANGASYFSGMDCLLMSLDQRLAVINVFWLLSMKLNGWVACTQWQAYIILAKKVNALRNDYCVLAEL